MKCAFHIITNQRNFWIGTTITPGTIYLIKGKLAITELIIATAKIKVALFIL